MAAVQYDLLYNYGSDDGIAAIAIPEPSSGTLISFGGYAFKDPGGVINDSSDEVSPSDTGANPIGQCPLLGSYIDTDGSHFTGMLLFEAPPGARIVVRTWAITV